MRAGSIVLLIGVGALLAVAVACSNQSEGERCDTLNGNDDCTGGLICYPQAQLKDTISDRCCPADRSKATASVCQVAVDILGGDASTPADSGPSLGPDASSDASADATSDAKATDGASDAAAETGP
jgi:hypothetical protein